MSKTLHIAKLLSSTNSSMPKLSSLETLQSATSVDTIVEVNQVAKNASFSPLDQSKTIKLNFHDLLQHLKGSCSKSQYYMTTQPLPVDEETGQPAILASPVTELVDQKYVALRPALLGNLVPMTCNLWLGRTPVNTPTSSGLHHDYHDNLYALISGTKTIRIAPPHHIHKELKTRGTLHILHANGRVVYREQLDKDEVAIRPDGALESVEKIVQLELKKEAIEDKIHKEKDDGKKELLEEQLEQVEDELLQTMLQNEEEGDDDEEEKNNENGIVSRKQQQVSEGPKQQAIASQLHPPQNSAIPCFHSDPSLSLPFSMIEERGDEPAALLRELAALQAEKVSLASQLRSATGDKKRTLQEHWEANEEVIEEVKDLLQECANEAQAPLRPATIPGQGPKRADKQQQAKSGNKDKKQAASHKQQQRPNTASFLFDDDPSRSPYQIGLRIMEREQQQEDRWALVRELASLEQTKDDLEDQLVWNAGGDAKKEAALKNRLHENEQVIQEVEALLQDYASDSELDHYDDSDDSEEEEDDYDEDEDEEVPCKRQKVSNKNDGTTSPATLLNFVKDTTAATSNSKNMFETIELRAGDLLYLPAGWFHEVSSSGGLHMALNYWMHPPDTGTPFGKPYKSKFWPRDYQSRGLDRQE